MGGPAFLSENRAAAYLQANQAWVGSLKAVTFVVPSKAKSNLGLFNDRWMKAKFHPKAPVYIVGSQQSSEISGSRKPKV